MSAVTDVLFVKFVSQVASIGVRVVAWAVAPTHTKATPARAALSRNKYISYPLLHKIHTQRTTIRPHSIRHSTSRPHFEHTAQARRRPNQSRADKFLPIAKDMSRLMPDPTGIIRSLHLGAERARKITVLVLKQT